MKSIAELKELAEDDDHLEVEQDEDDIEDEIADETRPLQQE